jgi:hypothetical protein
MTLLLWAFACLPSTVLWPLRKKAQKNCFACATEDALLMCVLSLLMRVLKKCGGRGERRMRNAIASRDASASHGETKFAAAPSPLNLIAFPRQLPAFISHIRFDVPLSADEDDSACYPTLSSPGCDAPEARHY